MGLLGRRLKLGNCIGVLWRLGSGALRRLLLLLRRRSGGLLWRSLHAFRSWRSSPPRILKFFQSVPIDRGLPGLSNAILVGDDVRLWWSSRPLRILGQCEKLHIAVFHSRSNQHYFVFRGKQIGKELGLNDDRHHNQQMQDDGDPHRLAPSSLISLILKFFNKEMKLGGILRQVAAQRAVL
jgi:hypothetical protein